MRLLGQSINALEFDAHHKLHCNKAQFVLLHRVYESVHFAALALLPMVELV